VGVNAMGCIDNMLIRSRVEATHFKPRNKLIDEIYGSDIRFQIWDDAPASLASLDKATMSSPAAITVGKQPEEIVGMEDERSLRMIFFIQNRIYIIYGKFSYLISCGY
jgi:hypothetical protein